MHALLAVDGFGPLNGWLVFAIAMFVVIVIGGGLGYVGRMNDSRGDRDDRSGR